MALIDRMYEFPQDFETKERGNEGDWENSPAAEIVQEHIETEAVKEPVESATEPVVIQSQFEKDGFRFYHGKRAQFLSD